MVGFKRLLACGVSAAILGSATAAVAQERSFDVPRGPAARSIPEFARQAGFQVIAPAGQLSGVMTPAIKGRQDARRALRRLIVGTGLEIASDDGSVIALRRVTAAAPAKLSAPASEGGGDAPVTEVVVTGSRIAGRVRETPAPVAILSAETLVNHSGGISVGDQLSVLPQFRATFTQAASTGIGLQAPGQVGLNLLDLRGLGPSRTLVLQDGQRLVSSSQQLSQPDTNTIPAELLERVEVLTGGASSVYGADAIAGVVNFVLKDNFEGAVVTAQGGISDHGDAGSQNFSIAVGKNFDGGRGNIAASASYAGRDGLRYDERTFSNGQSYFAPNPLAGQPGQSDTVLLENLHVLAQSAGGTIPYGPPWYRFSSDGTLNPSTEGSQTLGVITNGGNGLATLQQSSLVPDYHRYSFNLIGHYDVSDKVTLFGHLGVTQQRATAYAEPGAEGLFISTDNPYLSAQARSVLNSYGPTAGAPGFYLIRSLPELGALGERDDRLTIHSNFGAKGELGDGWRYQLSYGYGRTEITTKNINEYNPLRLNLAADAVTDTAGVLGAPGATVCRSRLSPHAANPDIDNCVPANVLGDGNISPEAASYIGLDTLAKGLLQQHLLSGFVAGDTRAFLELPGGPISMVVGGEFRRESTRYTADPRDVAGITNNYGAASTEGAVNVVEGYGEIKAPLLADVAWARRLELSGSLRVAHYNLPGVGTKASWGVGFTYEPVRDITFRGSYAKAVRAPNVAELYQPTVGTQFYIADPCDAAYINNGTANRAANCRALGVPAGYVGPPFGSPTPGVTGGNPNLDVERGRTWTIGALLTPSFLPGASLSVDYYHMVLSDAIVSPNPQVVIQQCVDSSDINNVFCAASQRDPVTHALTFITQQPLNLNRLLASGVDVDAHYGFELPWQSRGGLRILATYVIDRDDYRSPTQPDFPSQIVESLNNPRLSIGLTADVTHGPFNFSWNVRCFSSMYRADPSYFVSVGGLPPLHPNYLPEQYKKTGNTYINNVRGAWSFSEQGEIYAGVDNLFNVVPSPGVYGAGFGGAIYDNVGRFYYTGVKYRF